MRHHMCVSAACRLLFHAACTACNVYCMQRVLHAGCSQVLLGRCAASHVSIHLPSWVSVVPHAQGLNPKGGKQVLTLTTWAVCMQARAICLPRAA